MTVRSEYFRWVWPDNYPQYGLLTFPTNIGLGNGEVKRGKPMGIDTTNFTEMIYATGVNFFGLLMKPVDAYGTEGDKAMVDLLYNRRGINNENMPDKYGECVSLIVPPVFGMAEFEGDQSASGIAHIDNMVVTSGSGLISDATPFGTELSLAVGSWKVAEADEIVFAKMINAALTPVDDNDSVRIRIQFVSPYPKVADIYL